LRAVEIMLEDGFSLRKALNYSGLSSATYYYEPVPRVVKLHPLIVEKVKQVVFARPSYGARRIAATLSRELNVPVNRKRVGRVFRVLNWTTLPARKKSEIVRSSTKLVKATRRNELWETDPTYVWCGVDGWSYLFNMEDVFQREWCGYSFDTSAVKENAVNVRE
jgi:transposase InsO family protein